MKTTNFDRLEIIVEELFSQAQQVKNIQQARAFGKILDEIHDLKKKYPKDEE